ncbi:MAG: hypothetical protein MJA84_01760 [Firmicutes bacterium]|nr:hypothetical protein [Bacillota bacterium]
MSDLVLLQMPECSRQCLIKEHSFYIEQAQSRLLSQFDDIESEADRAAEEWLEEGNRHFDPDHHDPSDFYEAANDAGIEFYELLSDMKEQTRLAIVAGMFHRWEKRLRDWLVQETQHWHRGESVKWKIWSVSFGDIIDFLECTGWKIRKEAYHSKLDSCRLIVNVYKHGDGTSVDELRKRYPIYLSGPSAAYDHSFSDASYRDYSHLRVTDEHLQSFAKAIKDFWQDVPEEVLESQLTVLPDWFGKALQKDIASPQR